MAQVGLGLLACVMAGLGLDRGATIFATFPLGAVTCGGVLGLIVWLVLNGRHGERPRSSQRWAAAAVAGCVYFVARTLMIGTTASTWCDFALRASWLSAFLGAALLGGATAAMLLGHAYLTHTTMPIDPLMRLTRLLGLAVALRLIWAAGVLLTHRAVIENPPSDPVWLWMMLSVRVGVGLIGLGVLNYMVWDCVKRRSTQSATGILYIAMIFAYFGELAALELMRTYGLCV